MATEYLFLTGWEFGALGNMTVTGSAAVSGAVKRTGSYSLYCDDSSAGVAVSVGTVTDTLYVGVAYYPDNAIPNGCLITVGTDRPEAGIVLTSARQLQIQRNDVTATTVATGSVLQPNTWYYIEVAAKVNNTTGGITVKVNGVEDMTYSGDTCYTNERINLVMLSDPVNGLGGMSTGCSGYFDDLVISTGGWPGRCAVELLKPAGAGASTDLTPSAGSNYACVDEVPPNDDTDYVSSDTSDDHDSYALSNLTLEGTVKAVQWNARATLAEEGSGNIKAVLRSDGTDYASDDIGLDTTYAYYSQCYTNDPATDAVWERAAVDALEAGVMIG